MTNYERFQKANPDKLISLFNEIGFNPCDGCEIQCGDFTNDRVEAWLKEQYDCNSNRSRFFSQDYIDTLEDMRDGYKRIIEQAKIKKEPPSKKVLLCYRALSTALAHMTGCTEWLED